MNRPKPILPVDENLAHAIAAASIDRTANHRHDAIIVGAGSAGGMASAILSEAGMKVLTLDAGARRPFASAPALSATSALVQLLANPAATRLLPPAFIRKGRDILRAIGGVRQPIQREALAWAHLPEAFVDDLEFPYETDEAPHAFRWLRAHVLGGRAALPGRARPYYRLSPTDFTPRDERSPTWPLKYKDLVPWYEFVEKRIGLSGRQEGAARLPDSHITHHRPSTASESALIYAIKRHWPRVSPIIGRYATRADLMNQAAATGNLLCRTGALVRTVEVDSRGAARGVVWYDRETRRLERATAPIVFLCASALESTRILMMSGDGGIGNGSGHLGRNLMDHVMQRAEGTAAGLPGGNNQPQQAQSVFLPRFDQRNGASPSHQGFGVQVRQSPGRRGESWFTATALSEMKPHHANRISLDPDNCDALGAPRLRIHCEPTSTDPAASVRRTEALRELADLAGASLHRIDESPLAPGLAAHACGTARMGATAAESVLDPFNQCWEARGLYVTDAAAMVSQGSVGPALTVMALTARACAHALQNSPQETTPKARARLRIQRAAQARTTKLENAQARSRRPAPRKRTKVKAGPGEK